MVASHFVGSALTPECIMMESRADFYMAWILRFRLVDSTISCTDLLCSKNVVWRLDIYDDIWRE